MLKYTKEQEFQVIKEMKNLNGRSSKDLSKLIGIPDFAVRRLARKNNYYFGHYTPFQSASEITISDKLDQFIVGSLLGDGSVTINFKNDNYTAKNRNSKLSIKHSIVQKEYLMFKKSLIENDIKTYISYIPIKSKKKIINNKIIKDNGAIVLETLQNKTLNCYRDKWYKNGIKFIPKDLTLTNLSIAIWFQDDGSLSLRGGYYLSTNGFEIFDVEFLGDLLNKQFNIKTSVHVCNIRKQPKLYIKKGSIATFNNLVLPYMCKSMLYKLHQ
jgi:hypothetical protein